MDKYSKIAVVTCIAVLLLTGCNPEAENTGTDSVEKTNDVVNQLSQAEPAIENATTTDSHTDLIFIQSFSKLMNTRPSACEIAEFMELNLMHSATDEADLALSRLLLAQDQVRTDWNQMFMDGMAKGYHEMGYEWSPENIDKITDPETKHDYQKLIDGYSVL